MTTALVMERSLPGPETIIVHEYPNGLRLYIYENHAVPAVVIDGSLAAGNVFDPPEKGGLAALTAGMLRRGTSAHTFEALNEIIESVGAAIEISGGRHATDIYANCLSEDLNLILDLLAEMLCTPAFPPEEFSRLKQQTLTHIQEREHDTRSMAFITFRRLLYGDSHPYGRPVTGLRQTVERITLEDVETFYRTHIGARGGQLVIVGDVEPGTVIEKVGQVLGDWEGHTADLVLPPVEPVRECRQEHVYIEDKTQSDIVLGWLGIPRKHPDWTPLAVANTVWGQFGMGGRIGDRVREKQGLAYYAYGSVDGNFGPGAWTAAAGVAPQNTGRAIESILTEARRLREEPVTPEELADVQRYIIGSLPIRLETNEGLAAAIADMAWYNLGLDYLQKTEERVRAVTVEDVQRVAQMYMDPEHYVLAVAGP